MAAEKDPLLSVQRVKKNRSYCYSPECLKKLITLSVLWIAYLVVNSAFSVLSPFFPHEADAFGVHSLVIGFIVGVSPLCVVILSPVLGYFVPKIGLKFMIIAGLFLVGGSTLLTGFLVQMTNTMEFIIFSVLLRTVAGVGTASYLTSSLTVAANLFPAKTGTVTGMLEVGCGLGFVIGPPIGGSLYEFGGFLLPFAVTGGLVLFFIPLLIIIIPQTEEKKKFVPILTMFKLLKDPTFVILCISNTITIASFGFYIPVLSPFLISQFNLSQLQVSLVFLIGSLAYMIASLFAGRLTDIKGPRYIIILGLLITAVSLFFVGPAPFILSTSWLWLTCVSLGLSGVGDGLATVPVFTDLLRISKRIDVNTSPEIMTSVVSGISSATISLGQFVGPIVGGGLSEVLSFQMVSAIIGFVLVAQCSLLLGITLTDCIINSIYKPRVPSILSL